MEGIVKWFDSKRGYGFIISDETHVEHFCHFTGTRDEIKKDDKVQFELEMGRKGIMAVKVKRINIKES